MLSFPAFIISAQPITVTLDGNKLTFEVEPVLENGRVLVPLRSIFEALGARVDWDEATSTVTAVKGNDTIQLVAGRKTAYRNGNALELDMPAKIVQGRMLVPVRFVSESLNARVDWDDVSRTVVIRDRQLYHEQVIAHLEAGDLVSARRVALSAPLVNPFPELNTGGEVSFGYTVFFPEGEAGRYYIREAGLMTYVEAVDGVFTVVWQARNPFPGEESILLPADDTFTRHVTRDIALEYGLRPRIEKPLVFFQRQPTVNLTLYGRIHSDGTLERLGGIDGTALIAEVPGENPSSALSWRKRAAWEFKSELAYNFLAGRAGDTLLILADDGQIGGFHENSILYGIDERSGKKIWSISGGYTGIRYIPSLDNRHLAVLYGEEPELKWIDARSGVVLWERNFPGKSIYDLKIALAGGLGVKELDRVVIQLGDETESHKLLVFETADGGLLWEKQLHEEEGLLPDSRETPVIMLTTPEGITALDPSTGRQKWRVSGKTPRNIDSHKAVYYQYLATDNRYFGVVDNHRWLVLADRFVKIDLSTGKTLAAIENNPGRHLTVLDDRYVLVQQAEEDYYLSGKTFSTLLYDTVKDLPLWETWGRILFGIIEGEVIYLTRGSEVLAMDLSEGNILWNTFIPQSSFDIGKQQVIAGDRLYVPAEQSIFVLNKNTGDILYLVVDVKIGAAQNRGALNGYGMLTGLDEALYAGSADGYFHKISKDWLVK